jgi:type I restriction enzyme, S subunit
MSSLPPGWARARVDEIADVRLGRQRSPKNHTGNRMRPYLRAANVNWSGLDLSDVKEMNFTEAESATYELHRGDVLLAEASGTASEVGKPAVWRNEIEGCCFQNTLIRVRPCRVSSEYLRYFFFSEARSGRIGAAAPGIGIHHIGSARLAVWPVAVPPINEQLRIVAAIEEQFSRLDAIEKMIETLVGRFDRGKGRIGVLRRSILEHAFRGELVPQDSSDESAAVLLERIRTERATDTRRPRKRRATV